MHCEWDRSIQIFGWILFVSCNTWFQHHYIDQIAPNHFSTESNIRRCFRLLYIYIYTFDVCMTSHQNI